MNDVAANSLIAPCGLDCRACDIYQAAHDPDAAVRLAEAFRAEGRADAVPEWFRCEGCPGDREAHWSSDCGILACCVDDRGLASCAACDDFSCRRLEEWATRSPRYAAALERLRRTAAR